MSTQLWDYGPPLLSSYPQISKHALASHPVVTCNHFEKATWDQQIFGLYGLQIIHSHHSQRFGRRRKKHGAWPSHKNDAGVWCCVPADSSLISPQILGIDQAQLFSQLLRRAVKWWLVGGYSTWRLYNLYQCWYPYLLLVFLSSLRFLSWLFWITPPVAAPATPTPCLHQADTAWAVRGDNFLTIAAQWLRRKSTVALATVKS
jgi:hypothetical protein